MPKPELRVFRDLEELSREAASEFRKLATESLSAMRVFTAALSGGATPRRLYESLAELTPPVAWASIHLFQVDERSVPPDHPESNFRMIQTALLDRVPAAARNFHRMAAERPDKDEAAREYARELAAHLCPAKGEPPRLDLIILGMGADGHTASLFPSTPALSERQLWVRPNYNPKLQSYRLTLTYPVLNAAARVFFLVSGPDKAETLRAVLEGPSMPDLLPAQGVQPAHGRLSWFLDEAARKLLGRPARGNT